MEKQQMKNKNLTLHETLTFITITIFCVFIFYFHTLFYSIKAFDELIIFKESYLPIPLSFSEIPELISNLGLHQHVESNNMLYSNIFSLSNFYLNQKNLTNAEKIITEGLNYYPNYIRILPRAIKLYALKNDLLNLAKYEYLLGLRTHSQEAYQKSLQIYLLLNRFNEAKKILDKLLFIDKNNPATLLLANKYYSRTHGKVTNEK